QPAVSEGSGGQRWDEAVLRQSSRDCLSKHGFDLLECAIRYAHPDPCRRLAVKMVIAIIQPTKLNVVREALAKVGVTRLTVCDAQGYGRQRGQTEMYRGVEYKTNLLRKIALEIVVNEDFLERTLETIVSVARTGP